MRKQWKQWLNLFWGSSKITANGDCSHEIKIFLLLGRKVMTNLDSILKSRDTTLLTKIRLVKAMVFPVVMYGCESWTVKNTVSPSISHAEMGPDAMIFVFWMLSFKPTFSLSSFTFSKRLFSSLKISCWKWMPFLDSKANKHHTALITIALW